jgi:hypothetical protein
MLEEKAKRIRREISQIEFTERVGKERAIPLRAINLGD